MPNINFDRQYQGLLSETQQDDPEIGGGFYDLGTFVCNTRRVEFNKTWVRTPGFFSKIKSGEYRIRNLPMNNFSYRKKVTELPYGNVTWHEFAQMSGDKPVYRHYTFLGAMSCASVLLPDSGPGINTAIPQIDRAYVINKAANATLLELKDQKVNIWQAFAEREQTVRLMTKFMERATTSVISLKKGNFGAAARALGVQASPRRIRKYKKGWSSNQSDAIAQGWLELVYGWKPLLQDIYGSAELLAQKNVREIRNRVIKPVTRVAKTMGVSPIDFYGGRIQSRCEIKYTAKYTIYFSTSEVNHTLAQIGLTNPALILWELTPWSFVVDWFLPIGNYISGLDATNGLTFEKGCLTTFEKISFYSTRYGGPGINYPQGYKMDGTLYTKSEEVKVERQAISAFPSNHLPQFKNPVSLVHFANALALFKTAFGRN